MGYNRPCNFHSEWAQAKLTASPATNSDSIPGKAAEGEEEARGQLLDTPEERDVYRVTENEWVEPKDRI